MELYGTSFDNEVVGPDASRSISRRVVNTIFRQLAKARCSIANLGELSEELRSTYLTHTSPLLNTNGFKIPGRRHNTLHSNFFPAFRLNSDYLPDHSAAPNDNSFNNGHCKSSTKFRRIPHTFLSYTLGRHKFLPKHKSESHLFTSQNNIIPPPPLSSTTAIEYQTCHNENEDWMDQNNLSDPDTVNRSRLDRRVWSLTLGSVQLNLSISPNVKRRLQGNYPTERIFSSRRLNPFSNRASSLHRTRRRENLLFSTDSKISDDHLSNHSLSSKKQQLLMSLGYDYNHSNSSPLLNDPPESPWSGYDYNFDCRNICRKPCNELCDSRVASVWTPSNQTETVTSDDGHTYVDVKKRRRQEKYPDIRKKNQAAFRSKISTKPYIKLRKLSTSSDRSLFDFSSVSSLFGDQSSSSDSPWKAVKNWKSSKSYTYPKRLNKRRSLSSDLSTLTEGKISNPSWSGLKHIPSLPSIPKSDILDFKKSYKVKRQVKPKKSNQRRHSQSSSDRFHFSDDQGLLGAKLYLQSQFRISSIDSMSSFNTGILSLPETQGLISV